MAQSQITQNPATPGATGLQAARVRPTRGGLNNQYAVHGMIAKSILAHYKMMARLAPTTNRAFQSEFGGELTESPNGDTLTLRRMQTYALQSGLETWAPQPMLQELINLTITEPKGVQTAEEWLGAGLYRDGAYANASEVARQETLTYGIEDDVAAGMQCGYQMGDSSFQASINATTGVVNANGLSLAPPGKESEPAGRWPDNSILTYVRSELMQRGLQGRTLHACLDNYTSASFGRTALFTQQYGAGGAGAAAQSMGSLDGQKVADWMIADSSLNGNYTWGRTGGSAGTLTLRNAVTDGDTSIDYTKEVGTAITVGTKISFPGIYNVNRRTLRNTGVLAQFTVVSLVSRTDTTGSMTIFPAIRFGTGTSEAARKRNVSALPTSGKILINSSGGQKFQATNSVRADYGDIAAAQVRAVNATAAATTGAGQDHGRQTTRSFLVAQDSTLLIYSLPYVDPNGPVPVSKMELPDTKLAYCIAIDQELAPTPHAAGSGVTNPNARSGHLTLYEAWTRIGVGVGEWEAGAVITGGQVG